MQNPESRTLLAQKITLVEPDADEHQPTDQPQRPMSSHVHFEDALSQPEQLEPARGPLPQERKPKVYTQQSHSVLAPEIHDNSAALRIDCRDTLVAEVARDPDEVLSMILGMRSKYMLSLKQAKDSDNQPAILCGKSIAVGIEQELELNRSERAKLLKKLVGLQIRVLCGESSGLFGQFDATQSLIAQCEKKIESLQNILSAKTDPPFSHIKKPTPQQPQPPPHSTHALTAQANNRDEIRRLPLSKVPLSEDNSVAHTRQTMKTPDPLICKSKVDSVDSDQYPSDSSKLICAKERLAGDNQPAILRGTSTVLGIEQELELKQIERVKLLKRLVGAQIRLLRRESSGLLGQFDATQILLALCEKRIESLQIMLSAKTDLPFSYIKKPTSQQPQPQPHSTHALTAQANDRDEEKCIVKRRRPLSKAPLREDDYSVSHTRQTLKVPDPAIFTNGKDPTIDQWLFNMRAKFEFDSDHYFSESNKLMYAKGRVGGKAQEYLEAYLHSNSLTSFSNVEDLFAHLQHIFGRSPDGKECSKGNQSRDLDKKSSAVKNFYREFTRLAPHPPPRPPRSPPPPPPPRTRTSTSTNNVAEEQQQLTYETSIMEFMDKIGPVLRERLNSTSKTELPENIKYLGKRCLDIFDEMKAATTGDESSSNLSK